MKLILPKSLAIIGVLIVGVGSSCTGVRQAMIRGYRDATLKGNEELLRKNLKALGEVIDQYAIDNALT